jgi:excisionase family DNA binding protein
VGITDTDGQVLLTLEEAVEFLQLSRATIYRLIHRGALERRKLPKDRQTYVPLSSLETFKAAQGLSLEELSVRLVLVERKLEFLLHQGQQTRSSAAKPVRSPSAVNLDSVMRTINKHHPGILKN